MSANKFTDEFQRDAVAQVEDRGYPVREVAKRLGVSTKSIYTWQKLFLRPAKVVKELGLLATGVTDWSNVTQEQFEAASAWLRQAHPNVVTYWADGAELAQLMTKGEASLAWAWNETPTTLIGEGVPVASNREAAEGSSSWFCGYVNVVDGPNSEDLMYDFLNAWMEPATADYIVEAWGYGSGNQTQMASLGSELLDSVGLGEVSAPVLAQGPLDNRMREQMIVEFENIKAGF